MLPIAWAAEKEPTIEGIVGKFQNEVLVPLISLIFVLATVIFLWGILQYVVGSRGDEAKLKKGKSVMTWGIVGMAIMASAWGIVRVICNYFGTCVGVGTTLQRTDSGTDGNLGVRRDGTEVLPGGRLPEGVSRDILLDDEFANSPSQPRERTTQPPREIDLGGETIQLREGQGSYLFKK
ncbi:MAG: pilin [bacterium]|nr:pilin [bacterium]